MGGVGHLSGIGIPVLASGVLRIVAGIRNYSFKGRVLGMVSICLGVSVGA